MKNKENLQFQVWSGTFADLGASIGKSSKQKYVQINCNEVNTVQVDYFALKIKGGSLQKVSYEGRWVATLRRYQKLLLSGTHRVLKDFDTV